MNANQTSPDLLPPPESPEADQARSRRSLADRILAWSFLASIVVNVGWVALVSHSNLFGGGAVPALKEHPIKVFHPIPVKPKPPKPIKPPPPPPPQRKPPPPIKQIIHPPRPVPPRPQTPHPPPPVHQMQTVTTTNKNTTTPFQMPATSPNTETTKPTASGTSSLPTPPAPTPPPPAPPQPKYEPPTPPAPQQPAYHAPPPPPKPVYHPPPPPPKPAIPDRDEPEMKGSFSDIQLPEFDPGSVNTTSVTVTWSVDPRGHPSDIKFRPTGNSDVDDAIRNAVQNFRFRPAVHNGVAQTAPMEHTFTIG